MKRISAIFKRHSIAFFLFLIFAAAISQTVSAENLGSIMPMGDSITYGVPVAGGYRDPLYTLLNNRGDTFSFVGSSTGYATTLLTSAGQDHHEGHSGYVITNGVGRTGLHENLVSWIGPGGEDPDKILLMIGTNDIDLDNDVANAPTRLNDLINHIYSYEPDVTLYLASIVPINNNETKNANVQAFNAAMPGIVTNQQALGRNVILVPMYDAIDKDTDLADNLHPNAQGYQNMADTWDEALHLTTNLTVEITSPSDNQVFAVGTEISASAEVTDATGAYTVHIYTNSSSGAFAEAGSGGSSTPYQVSLGTLPPGAYNIYATVTDTLSTTNSTTNTFSVAQAQPGQQVLSLSGWNHDIIIGASESAPEYTASMASWNFYETGLSGGTQGLPADSGDAPRTFTCANDSEVDFQFAPYGENNAVYIAGAGSVTLSLNTPGCFHALQFLNTARSMSWYAQLNFADGSSADTTTWNDPDWTNTGAADDVCLSNYGLKNVSGSFYSGSLWMAGHEFVLAPADQRKTLSSITIHALSDGDRQLALFAVSGYMLDSSTTTNNAVNVLTDGDGVGLGDSFSVGWDFSVSQTIRVTALGQFDPDSNPTANTVAIYQRAGSKLVEASVLATDPAEMSGNYSARYTAIDELILPAGDYVVFSTQNGNNFVAPGGNPDADIGPAITWNKGVAQSGAAGPLPTTAPVTWGIENVGAYRYIGPTFKYEIVIPPPIIELTSPVNSQELSVSDPVTAEVTVAATVGDYSVHVYTNSGSGAFAEVGAGGSNTPYQVSLGILPAGTYGIYASITDENATTNTVTNTFSVAVQTGQQTLALTGWNQDLIIGATEAAPEYTTSMSGWNFYETGLAGSSQGLAADSGDKPRSFYSGLNPNVQFQFAPYDGNNAVYIDGTGNVTLDLVNQTSFYSLQFLMTTRSMSWYAQLNFTDGSSTTTPEWSDPDWTNTGDAEDVCLTSYGLRKASDGSFYTGGIWMAERGYVLSADDREKTLESITFYTTGNNGFQLALFAVSGYALVDLHENLPAVELLSEGSGPGGGSTYAVGWDFTVSETITVTALGQFDPDSNPTSNSVAIYQRGGAKLVEVSVLASDPSEQNGNYPARYAAIDSLVLPAGDYVVFSSQNGDNFIAGSETTEANIGPAVTWNKGVALDAGSADDPLPETAPEPWPINNTSAYRYFGPTFKYFLGVIYPEGTLIILR